MRPTLLQPQAFLKFATTADKNGRHRFQCSTQQDDVGHSGKRHKTGNPCSQGTAHARVQVQNSPLGLAGQAGYRLAKIQGRHPGPWMLLAHAQELQTCAHSFDQNRVLVSQTSCKCHQGSDCPLQTSCTRMARSDNLGVLPEVHLTRGTAG